MRPKLARLVVFATAMLVGSSVAPRSAFAQDDDQKKADVRVTKPPKLVNEVRAEYTEKAVENRVEGPVELRLTISATGEVTKVEVLEGLGYGLDEAAVEAAKQFEFEPAEINNQPSSVVLTFTVNFSLPILPATFRGKVVDAQTGDPVPATVAIEWEEGEQQFDEAPTANMATGPDGTFEFSDVPPGSYSVSLEVQGYEDHQTEVELVQGETSEVDFTVTRAAENLVGEVIETGTRNPLPGIKVILLDAETSEIVGETYTADEGRFGFRELPPGSYKLQFKSDAYFPHLAEVEVRAGEVTEAKFFIEAEYYDEYSVETTAKKARTEVNRRRLELEEIRRIPGSGGDVVRVVQNLPGVARQPFGSGLIIVRGAAPQDTKFFIDGDNIPIIYHFFGGPAVINSEMIDSLEFFPGNFSTYYGRAIGGIIDLSTRSPRDDRIHGLAEVDLLDATAMVEGPITDDLSIAISGRRSYFDVFLPLVLPQDGPDVFVAPRYYDAQIWLTYRGFDNHLLELVAYGSDDRIEIILPPDDVEGNAQVQVTGIDITNSFYRGQGKWVWRPDAPVENTFMASYGVNTFGFELAENLFFETDYWFSQIRDDMRFEFSENFTLRMGADMVYGNAVSRFEFPAFENSADDEDIPTDVQGGIVGERRSPQLTPAFYVEPEIELFDERLLLVPGVRIDHYGPFNHTDVSPRFTTRFDVTDQVTAKGGIGLFTQPPVPGLEDPEFGNPELVSEKAMHYAVGAEWRPIEWFEIDGTLFYRDLFDLVEQSDAFDIEDDSGDVDFEAFDNKGEGRAYGLELLIRHYPQNRFFGWLAYTLSRSERLDPETGEYNAFEYDQTHILTLVAGYNLPENFDVSGRFRVVTGTPYTPITDASYNADVDDYIPITGEPNSARNATFHQLDLRVDKKFVFKTWILGFYLDVQNVYNHINEEGRRYNYDYSEVEPVRGIPIIPTLGVSGKF